MCTYMLASFFSLHMLFYFYHFEIFLPLRMQKMLAIMFNIGYFGMSQINLITQQWVFAYIFVEFLVS